MFTTKRLIGAAMALSLAIFAAPAKATTLYGWSPPVWLSNTGQHAWTPEVAYADNGNAVFAWGRYTGSDYVAQAVTRSANGTLGQVRRIADPATMPIYRPHVGVDRLGNSLLAWTRYDGADSRVQARTLSAAGELGDIETLSNAGHSATEPEIAVNGDGAGVVTWTRYDGSHTLVEARSMSTAGDVGGLETVSDDNQDATNADIGIDADGDTVFVWQRSDPADDLILTRTLDADGTLDAVRTLSAAGGFADEPQVKVNEAGDAAYTWTRWDGANHRIQGRVDLGPLGSIMTLSASGESASNARSAIDATGNAMFAWSRREDGTDWRIQSVRVPAGPTGVPGVVETHSDAGQPAAHPQLAIEPGGTAALAWTRWDGAISRVQVRRLPAVGNPSAVNTPSAAGEDTSDPHIAVRSGGKILLTWTGFDGSDWRIKYSYGAPEAEVIGDTVPAGGAQPRP